MQTFKQYFTESLDKQEYERVFSNEPFRFKPFGIVIDFDGVNIMGRRMFYGESGVNRTKFMTVRPSDGTDSFRTILRIEFPVIFHVPDYDIGSLQYEFKRTDKNNLFTDGLQLFFFIHKLTPFIPRGKGIYEVLSGDILGVNIVEQIKIYNVYEDTPGSEADKTLAVAKFIGLERTDILKLKQRFGLLTKEDELSDKDTLDLF